MKTIVSSLEILESRIAPATFAVTTLADTTNVAHDTGSLRDALALADDHSGPDTIVFHLPAPPLHSENIITLTGGDLISHGNVTIKGPGAGKLIIDGNNASRVFYINDTYTGTDSPVTISGLSMVHASSGATGGAIYSAESLTLKSVVISGNSAKSGGGVAVSGDATAGTNVSITNSLITGNDGTTSDGGMNLSSLKSLAISKTVVTGNTAPFGSGGLYASINSTGTGIKITGSQISGNSGKTGGGLFVKDDSTASTSKITITGTKITGNTSTNAGAAGGGGLYIGAGNAFITGSTILGNTATNNGGGIQTGPGFASLTISSSTISGNKTTVATDQGGGGLFIQGGGSGTEQHVKITGSHFNDNQSAQYGGGVFAFDGVALTISGSTFSDNHARFDGGGVWGQGTGANKADITVSGGAFSDNTAGNGGGGIGIKGDGALSITASKLTGNISGAGGGILVDTTTGAVTIKNAVVTGNFATDGGGIFIVGTPNNFQIIGGRFTGNGAGQYGGGIYVGNSTGSITGATISGNAAGLRGGGVFNEGPGTITLQIAKVIANSAPSDPDAGGPGPFTFV